MSLLQEITSPVIFSWVEKSLTHPIQRDIFLGKIWIWISSATDLCRWPNETATSKLSRVWHCHPHTYVVVLFSTVSLCDTSTTWACQDSEEFGEHQEGFFTTCQVHCEYSHGMKGLLMTICWNKRAVATNFWFSNFAGIRMILTAHPRKQESPGCFTVLSSALILMPEWLLHYTVKPSRSLPMGWQCKFIFGKVSAVEWC